MYAWAEILNNMFGLHKYFSGQAIKMQISINAQFLLRKIFHIASDRGMKKTQKQ